MSLRKKQSGISLIEMTVVVATIALLATFSVPAIRTMFNSFERRGSARPMISAALSSARAIAVKEQRYAGIRFQEDKNGNHYMIFIVQEPQFGAYFFRAVDKIKPIKLPENTGVMDFLVVVAGTRNNAYPTNNIINDSLITDDGLRAGLRDTKTFSIMFSPEGRLVIHKHRVRNRDNIVDSGINRFAGIVSFDDIFNSTIHIADGIGMFYQDDYWGDINNGEGDRGLGPEVSRNSFVIYDKAALAAVKPNSRYTDYLSTLKPIYINTYTGAMINTEN